MGGKKITLGSMVMFGISSLVVLYTVAKSAAFGVSGLGCWIIMTFLFVIPSILNVAELGSTYTEAGGISMWVTKAFGDLPGSLTGWWYWVNYVFGLPSVYVTVVGIAAAYFWPAMPTTVSMAIVIALIAATCACGIYSKSLPARISAYGGTVIIALIALLVVLAIAFTGANGGVPASDLSLAAWVPTPAKLASFCPVIVFNTLGMELLTAYASECENPERDVPRFTIISGIAVVICYMVATVAILAVIPEGQVDTVNGFADAIRIAAVGILGEQAGSVVVTIAVIAILYALIASGVGWAAGCSAIISDAGLGDKSKILGHKHPKFGTSDYAFYIVGGVGILFTIAMYMGGDSVNAIFDMMFSFSSIIFLASYAFMYPSLARLRRIDPDRKRPFAVPKALVWYASYLPAIMIVIAMVVFSLPSNGGDLGTSLLINWGGFALVSLVGFGIYPNGKRREKAEAASVAMSEE